MASLFWVGGTGTWDASDTTHWSTSSGGAGGAAVPTSADTVTLDASSGGGTITVNTSFTITSLTMGAFTGTLDFATNNNSPTMQSFNASGTGTRTLNMGSGTWSITGTSGTVWNISTATNMTMNQGTGTVDVNANTASSRTINTNTAGLVQSMNNLKISAGTGNVTFSGVRVTDLDFTGYSTGTWTTGVLNIGGSLTLGSGMLVTSSSNTITFSATTSKTITSNSVQMNVPVTFNGTGGTWTLQDDFSMDGTTARTLTITAGTFDANGHNVTAGVISSSNSNTRTISLGSGTWYVTGSGGTVWNMGTTTGLTFNASTSTVDFNYSGSTGTRTLSGQGTSNPFNNVKVSAGADGFTSSALGWACVDLDFSGFTGTWSAASMNVAGNLTLGGGMAVSSNSNAITFTATSSKTISTNGVPINMPLTFNGVSGTWVLQDDLSLDGASARTLTLTNGTLDANNNNVTAGLISSSNSNTRAISMGTGTWTLTSSGTVWNLATTTGLTVTPSTSTIKLTDASATAKTFSGGGKTYYNIWLTGAGTGTFDFVGSNTFNNFKADTPPHTIRFTAGTTTTVTSWSVSGSSGNLMTISSITGASHTLTKSGGRQISSDYLSVTNSTASPANTWFAGANSTDGGGNSGWLFTVVTPPVGQYLGDATIRLDTINEYSSAAGVSIDGLLIKDGGGKTLLGSTAYTPTNVTTDRSYDANATTTDELADVLGTLIADLQNKGILS